MKIYATIISMTANDKKYSLFASIKLAAGGIWQTIKGERNMRIHLVAGFVAVTLGLVLRISRFEWLVIILIIFAVLAAEVFNSAIEEVADVMVEKLSLGYRETKWARDMAAGAVLLLAIGAVVLGLIIFLPYFFF